jgi:hypothetical protein
MKKVTIALVMLLLAGCETQWTKYGATGADERNAEANCRRSAGADDDNVSDRAAELFAICMESNGWSEKN